MSNFNLVIHCQNLKDKDTFSKSDPRCRVNLVNAQTHTKVANLGCTETINNDLNPQFRKTIDVPRQYCSPNTLHLNLLEFIVEDSDGLVNDKLGTAFISLSDVINSHEQSATRRLTGNGSITVFVDNKSQGSLSFMLRGIKIASMDFLGKSDPFFEMIQRGQVLYKSEHVMNSKSPKWKGFEIGINRVKMDEEMVVRVYDYDGANSKPDFIGECKFRPDYMKNNQVNREIELLGGRGGGKSKGFLCVDQCQLIKGKGHGMKNGHGKVGGHVNIYGNHNYGQNSTAPITYGQNPYAPRPGVPQLPANYGVPSQNPSYGAPSQNPYPAANAPHNAYPPQHQRYGK